MLPDNITTPLMISHRQLWAVELPDTVAGRRLSIERCDACTPLTTAASATLQQQQWLQQHAPTDANLLL